MKLLGQAWEKQKKIHLWITSDESPNAIQWERMSGTQQSTQDVRCHPWKKYQLFREAQPIILRSWDHFIAPEAVLWRLKCIFADYNLAALALN